MGKSSPTRQDPAAEAMPLVRTAAPDERGRLTIPKEVFGAVTWLKDAPPAECILFAGAIGRIQVDHPDGSLGRVRRDLYDLLSSTTPASNEADDVLAGTARLISNSWTAKLEIKERRLYIPDAIGEMGLLKRVQGSPLVLFGYGAILEIWNPDEWLKRCLPERGTSAIDDYPEDLRRWSEEYTGGPTG